MNSSSDEKSSNDRKSSYIQNIVFKLKAYKQVLECLMKKKVFMVKGVRKIENKVLEKMYDGVHFLLLTS